MNSKVSEARPADKFADEQQDGQQFKTGRHGDLPPYHNFTMHERDVFTLYPASRKKGLTIDKGDIDYLKATMRDVLAHYGVADASRPFSSLWREDKNPSAVFYPDSCLVHDFGTGETLDVFSLVSKMEGIGDFPGQVRMVADIVGYSMGSGSVVLPPSSPKIQRPRVAIPQVAGFAERPLLPFAGFMSDLMENDAALSFLHGRGFTDEKAYQNVLGFVHCPKEVSASFTLHEPVKTLGYVVVPFPADNTFCSVHYVMLRAIPSDEPPTFKEIRPTGFKSPLYREWLVSCRCNVLCVAEGLLDCLAMEMLYNVPCVGLGGTGGAKRLASLLYYTMPDLRPSTIILALDADDAGRKAADWLLGEIRSLGIKCSIMEMVPGCKDPNDMLMMFGGD